MRRNGGVRYPRRVTHFTRKISPSRQRMHAQRKQAAHIRDG